MRWGVVALLCAACGGQGVDLEVDADVAFDRVELFVTYDVCRDTAGNECDQGVGWPNQTSRPPGTVYILRDDEKLISTATIVDGAAVLHLEAAYGFADTKAIAIAAYQGNHVVAATVLWDTRIPLHSAERWKVHLDPTADATVKLDEEPNADAPTHRALAWPREASPDVPDPSDYAGCFVYQKWDGSEWHTDYFVPETDMDCDGAPPDCTPLWNHHDPEMARCVTNMQPTGFCTLGTPTCTDETPGTTCMPNTPITCLPQEVCALCGDAGDLAGCLQDQIANGTVTALTSAECRFPLDDNTQGPCDGMFGNKLTYTLPTSCPNGNPTLRDPAMPFSAGSAQVTTPNGAEFVITSTSDLQTCHLQLEWKQGMLAMDHHFLLVVNLPFRVMVLPLTIGVAAPMTACPPETATQANPCAVHGPGQNDTLFQCIRGQ